MIFIRSPFNQELSLIKDVLKMDISKCLGKDCDKKGTCWRYIAPGYGTNQSMCGYDPLGPGGNCQNYWYVVKKGEKKK
jgi:hypothetical protein